MCPKIKPSEFFKCSKYLQYNITSKLLVAFLRRNLVKTLLEILNDLIEFVIFHLSYKYSDLSTEMTVMKKSFFF